MVLILGQQVVRHLWFHIIQTQTVLSAVQVLPVEMQNRACQHPFRSPRVSVSEKGLLLLYGFKLTVVLT